MNENEAVMLVNNLTNDMPVSPAPVSEILRAGQRGHRRRRRFQVAGVAAAVAVVAVGGFAVARDPGTRSPQAQGPTTSSSTRLSTPPGTRLVGMNGVAVAVPQSWGTNDTSCVQDPAADTVVFENNRVGYRTCRLDLPVSSVFFGAPQQPMASVYARKATPAGDIDGVAISRAPVLLTRCDGHRAVDCEFVGAVTVPSRDVVVWVQSPDRSTVETILGSTQLIPGGYTAVPDLTGVDDDVEASRLLDSVGLRWDDRCPPGQDCAGLVVGATDPAAGSVVTAGTLVRPVGDTEEPTRITCPGGRSVGATIDTFSPPEPGVSFDDVVNRWVVWHGGFDANDVWGPNRSDRETVFLLRPDGTAHTRLNLSRASNGSWYLDTYAACPSNSHSSTRPPTNGAEHVALSPSGAIAAWFDESGSLPELVVYNTEDRQELAREDLGIGEVATNPFLTVTDDAVYYQTAVDPNVQMRYRWAIDAYPYVYD